MSFDIMSIIAYIAGLLLTYVFCRIFIRPIKWLLKTTLNGILGGIILLLFKFLGGFIGLSITVNPVTALITGFLGLPGAILVIVLQHIL